MYSNRLRGITRLHFLFQQAVVLLLLWTIYPLINWWRFDGALSSGNYLKASAVLIVAALVEFFTREPSYRSLTGLSRQQLAAVSHRQTLFALVSIFGSMVMFKDSSLSRMILVAFFTAYFIWIGWSNRCGHRWLHRRLYRNSSKGRAAALLVGSPGSVGRFCSSPRPPQPPGTDILGFVPVGGDAAATALSIELPRLGGFEDLRMICENTRAKALLMLGLNDRRDLISPVSRISRELGLRTVWIDEVGEQFGRGSEPFHTETHSVVSPMREPLEDPLNRAIKRAFDLAGALFGVMVVMPPLMLTVAVLHRLYSPGPLFFWQDRTGRGGETFRMLKFRSMMVAGSDEAFQQATKDDPRIFRGGNLLRKLSLDELPQLVNVLKGEMSLVGPRPHPPALDERLARESESYRLRHLAKPGITGLAQSRGWRGETRTSQQIRNRVRLDLFYLQHWSLQMDLNVIFDTVRQVIKPPESAC